MSPDKSKLKKGEIMDNKKTIVCPACGKEMEKIFIPEPNVNVDICLNGCGGMFFDNRELDKFDEHEESIAHILHVINNKKFEEVDKSAKRICPVCGIPMVKLGSNTDVEIDSCNMCGATFLDNGELERLRELNNKDNKMVEECLGKIEASMPKISQKRSVGRMAFENLVTNFLLK